MSEVETRAEEAAVRRISLYDGLRGIAIILVVLSHGWTLWPTDEMLADISEGQFGATLEPLARTLFTSGNFAVTIFFVVGFFLATRSLLRRAESGRGFAPVVLVARRYLRIGGQLAFALVALTLVTATDGADEYENTDTRTSLFRIMTFTWNQYIQTSAINARSDLGHLWYLSVDLQVFIMVVLLIWLLRRHRAWLMVTLGAIIIFCFVWRNHVYETEGVYQALLRTTVRMDAPLMGAFAATAMPYLSRLRPHAAWLAVVSLVSLFPLAHYSNSDDGYFGPAGAGVTLAVGLFMIATTLREPPALLQQVLCWKPIAFLGERSLSLYIWHYPLFWYISLHDDGWSTFERTIGGFALTLAASVVSQYLVERRVQRFLADERWRAFDRGLVHWAGERRRGAADPVPNGGPVEEDAPARDSRPSSSGSHRA